MLIHVDPCWFMLYDAVNPVNTSLFRCLKLVVSTPKSVPGFLASTKHGTKPRRRWKTAAGLAWDHPRSKPWRSHDEAMTKPWRSHEANMMTQHDPTWTNIQIHKGIPQRKLKVAWSDDVQWWTMIQPDHMPVLRWVPASSCFWDLLTWQACLDHAGCSARCHVQERVEYVFAKVQGKRKKRLFNREHVDSCVLSKEVDCTCWMAESRRFKRIKRVYQCLLHSIAVS